MVFVDGGSTMLIVILILLICGSAFFSASETALTSLSRIRLRNMVDEKVKNADKIQRLLDNPSKLLSTILVGNNLVNNGASALTTALAIQIFHGDAGSGAGVATAIITIVILIFGEITPKTIAAQKAEKVALFVVNVIAFFDLVFTPVVAVLNVVTGTFARVLGCNAQERAPLITEAELKTILNVSQEEGVLDKEERTMIDNVFNFGDFKARDAMTPRTDIMAVSTEATYEDFCAVVREERFSRVPVYEEDIDNIVGVLYVKDVFLAKPEDFTPIKYMREPFFTYESKPLSELFAQMRADRLAMAIVLDEYGGTSGLVTMEDMVEEIVGEIADEFDDEEEEIEVVQENEFVVEGSTRLEDLNEMVGCQLESDEVDTIAGYVLLILKDFPKGGEELETDGLRIRIESMDKNRIEKLRIYRIPQEIETEETEQTEKS